MLKKIFYFDIVMSRTSVMDLVSRTFQEILFLELFKKFYPFSCLFTLWGLNVVLSKMWPCLRDANGWVNFLDSSVEIYCPYSHNKWCQIDNDTDATLSYCGSSELYYQCWSQNPCCLDPTPIGVLRSGLNLFVDWPWSSLFLSKF